MVMGTERAKAGPQGPQRSPVCPGSVRDQPGICPGSVGLNVRITDLCTARKRGISGGNHICIIQVKFVEYGLCSLSKKVPLHTQYEEIPLLLCKNEMYGNFQFS